MPQIPEKIKKLLVEQVHTEFQAHNNYLAMAAFFERGPFKGLASWMRLQAEEEHAHGHEIFDYLADRGAEIILKELSAPKTKFNSVKEVFETALACEYATTASIHKIYDAALAAKDFGTVEMLNWFLKEQVEEESQTQEILDRVVLARNNPAALLQIDHEAGKRKAE